MRYFLFLFLIPILSGCFSPASDIRESISLAGEWNFRVDSLDRGLAEKWYETTFEESISLPGSMAENGKGDEVNVSTEWTGNIWDSSYFTQEKYEKYRQPGNFKIPFWLTPVKHYVGPAWYQKTVTLPEHWKGRRVKLMLERCHWESRVFINGSEAGSRNSLATPHEYDITEWLVPGTNRISIRIDNRMIIPVGVNSHSVSDHTQSNWNGIVGEISLEASSPVFIQAIEIFPDIKSRTARIGLSLRNQSDIPFEGELEIEAGSFNTTETHAPGMYTEKVRIDGPELWVEVEYPMGEGMQLWSEFSPALYRLGVKLKDGEGRYVDRQQEDFGMREFRTNGSRFEVNGHPVFLRGTLECCIFPLTGYPPTDVASWEHVLGRCKAHGLNHIRFHSWCPPEAAFRAADKLGIYFQVECSSWANQGSTLGDGSPIDDFIYAEGDDIMKAYGNHPSLCMMAYGNEPGGGNQNRFLEDLISYWKSRDRRRVYTSGAGWPILPANEFHNVPEPRIQHWGEGLESIINARPPQTMFDYRDIISPYDVPFVSHEIGQWCVYPDFREIDKYTGVLKATNFEIFKETLEENHMGAQAGDFLMASGMLQALCYKADIEAALRTPGFAGFQLLQLHDFPGQGTALVGVLDPFFDSKGYISPEAFRRFCSPTVPLARMEKRVFSNGETFRADIEMAHFGEGPLRDREIVCRIVDPGGENLRRQVFTMKEIPVDNGIPVGSVELDLRQVKAARKLILEVMVRGTDIANSWDFWVYPDRKGQPPGNVHITHSLDREAAAVLEAGGSVLLLGHGRVREDRGAGVAIGFSSIFWNTAWTRGQAPHTLGILVDPDHPLFEEFPTEYHSNWQWWDPVSHSQAMVLDGFPATVKPLIQPIDTWFENRRLALAFEVSTGPGKLLVCSIDLAGDMTERPVSRQLIYSMLHYMNSEAFKPGTTMDPDRVRELFNE